MIDTVVTNHVNPVNPVKVIIVVLLSNDWSVILKKSPSSAT